MVKWDVFGGENEVGRDPRHVGTFETLMSLMDDKPGYRDVIWD